MKKILVVDDEEDIVDLVRARLEANNYQVISANTGAEGVKMAIGCEPDLIVMDIMMPQMSGGEAVRVLTNHSSTKTIPIIFLTSLISKGGASQELGKINVDGKYYKSIAKPFKPQELLFEIKDLIGE